MSRTIKILQNTHLWIISAIFVACCVLHYPQQLPFLGDLAPSSILGLSRHAIERILFLFPIVYAGIVFGLRGGIIAIIAALGAMLPRVLFISDYFADALFETCAVIVSAGLANWWLEAHRRETKRTEQALLELKAAQQELQSHVQLIKENDKRLSALHAISTAVNQSLGLAELADVAADKIMEIVDIDAMLLFVLDREAGWLDLAAYRGISEEFARGVDRLKIGEGFNGWVARTGEALFVEDSQLDPRLSREVVKQERLTSQYITPLKSRDEVVGTLCVAVRHLRQFTMDEKELLRLIGIEIGIAIQKARLYYESQLAMRRFQELFEKAHDAIWVEDLEGKIAAANQATTMLTGYEVEDLIGRDVAQLLPRQALKLASEIRQKLLCTETTRQPYEQRIIRKNGEEAIITLTTSLLGDKDTPHGFQHIARDVTNEKRLQEDLRLYIDQVTRAHEEERNRIARELHDDTAQAIVAISRRLDSLASKSKIPEKALRPMEQIQSNLDDLLVRIRRFIQDLRPPTLEYLGFLPALRELVSQIREEYSIDANFSVKGKVDGFTKQEELLIYRIIQEALRNASKHSEAAKVDVIIESVDAKTNVTVSDNGKGFEHEDGLELARTGKLGLVGMAERARLLGGNLTIRSKLGSGTTIILDVPSRYLVM